MFSCIIFYIDGTFIDTKHAILSSLQRLVTEEIDKNYSFEELLDLIKNYEI